MSRFQYRITVNGAVSPIMDKYPGEQWTRVFEALEARGGKATFERRLITDHDITPLLGGILPKGYMRLDENTIVCAWDIIAEGEVR